MGGCFSSESYEEAECRPPRRVLPSDEDGMPCVGDPDVDRQARIFINNFHRRQSGCAKEPPRRVRRSDEDGMPCVGDPNVDRKARIFIDNFHRRQFGCAEEPPTPCSAAA